MSCNYNLTNKDFEFVQSKIAKQSKYLDQTFITAAGQHKTLRDVSFSANHSERYYSQLLNKVHTLDSYNIDLNNEPIFLTITLDGFFRDLVKGDYSRFGFEETCSYIGHIPNDERNGKILDKMFNKEPLTVKDCYKILSYQTRRFFRSKVFQNIRKKGYNYSYLRVTEPHKDGIPHFHILMYVPPHTIPQIHNNFKNYFPAPQNHKPLSYKRNCRLSGHLETGEKETQGFQFEIKKATGYILKYVLKSFTNVVNDEEVDYLQAWYIYHKIPRLISSHTIIPAWVYQKLALLDDDWYYHNNTHKNHTAHWQSRKIEDDCVVQTESFYFDDGSGRIFTYNNGEFELTHKGYVIQKFGEQKSLKINKRFKMIPAEDKKDMNIKIPLIPVIFDTGPILYITQNNLIPKEKKYYKSVKKMTLLELWSIYDNFDFDLFIPAFYGNIKNELISRGMLDLPIESLNDYNTNFDTGGYDDCLCG